jgi:cell wall-associated NlpC family hydrolase
MVTSRDPHTMLRAWRAPAWAGVALALAVALGGCGAAASAGPEGPAVAPAANTRTAAERPRPAIAPAPGPSRPAVALVRDTEADQSFPLPRGAAGGAKAPRPSAAPAAHRRRPRGERISPGAPSDAQIRRELKQMGKVLKAARRSAAVAPSAAAAPQPAPTRAAVTGSGAAQVPAGVPAAVARVIAGGNAIARFPYIWGGGHGSFVDTGYDCSGSVSYALAAAGLLDRPLVSGELARYGEPGPGRWITIYANAGHVFMYVAGLRFDTSGRDGPFGSRWQAAPRSLDGFAVRHPPGL